MASPPSGLNPQQVQEWADSLISNSLKRGFNPGDVGMGSQQDRDRWAQQLQGTSPQPNTPAPTGNAPNMSAYTPPAQKQPQGGYSAYTPGKAQPTQTPSQGTPYGQLPTTGSPATSYADAWNAAMPKGGNGVTFTPARSVIGAGAGNMAYAQPGQRPEGFVTQSYDLQGNPVAQGQQAQQRDAFIAQILQTPRDTPQYDFQGMLGKAGDMVKDGWQNPFNFSQPQGQPVFTDPSTLPPDLQEQLKPRTTQYRPGMYEEFTNDDARNWLSTYERQNQPTGPQSLPGGQPSSPAVQGRPDNRMAIQDLFTKNNVQAPQGFMDQLIALLGGNAPPPQMPPRPDVAAPDPKAPRPMTPASQPAGRYVPSDPVVRGGDMVDDTARQENAIRFIGELERANPATWTDQQWSDYERARSHVSRADLYNGAYYRGRDGQAQRSSYPYDPTLGNDNFQMWRNSRYDMGSAVYDRAKNEQLFDQYMSETGGRKLSDLPAQPPRRDTLGQDIDRPPVANPGTATPTPPKQYGTPYGQMTPPRVQPKPPPPRVLTDADVAAQEEAIRRVKSQAWVSANPNNWFMNPYNQDSPLVREVRRRDPTVNKSGNGEGGSSNRKFTRVNGQLKWT